jgi:hypothetical protein
MGNIRAGTKGKVTPTTQEVKNRKAEASIRYTKTTTAFIYPKVC